MINASWGIAIAGAVIAIGIYQILKLKTGSVNEVTDELLDLKKMAHMGDPDAQYQVGYLYEIGIGMSPHLGKAFYWYVRGAEKNHSGSIKRIAKFYMEGIYVDEKLDEGMWWMEPGRGDEKVAKAKSIRREIEKRFPNTPYSFMSDPDYRYKKRGL